MKIVNKNTGHRSLLSLFWLLLIISALVIGILLGNAGAIPVFQESWEGLERRLTLLSPASNLPLLTADIDFEDYSQLLEEREDARRQGILFPDDSTYVPADFQEVNGPIPFWIRLLPGSAEHLGINDKWNFEIMSRGEAALAGLTHANLIDPADNNWLYEWAFLESLRQEGLLAGDYQFVRLILNGDDRGIYALQEDLRPVVTSEDDVTGKVVISYDVDPLLEAVSYFGNEGLAAADPVSNIASNDPRFLQISEIDDPLITDDEFLSSQAERATALLRGLQNGNLTASDVFDAQQYGRFLALVDLWGAGDALSPLNLRYAYNSETDRLEPIPSNGNPLEDTYRVPVAAMYQDPQIQAAYAAAIKEFSNPEYLSVLREAIEPNYTELENALAAEVKLPPIWDMLEGRQEQLQLSLHPAQPVIAQLGSPNLAQEAIIRVQIANTLNLPLEILGFDIDGATFLESDPEWIVDGEPYYKLVDDRIILEPVSSEKTGLRFITFDLPVTEILKQDKELDFLNEIKIQVATSVLGIDDRQLTPTSPGLLDIK
ncbi:MAG: hypothetical protein ACK2U0_07030 [Candidatus Promineifilaceae bacterium]|jgi:hypothetical protein